MKAVVITNATKEGEAASIDEPALQMKDGVKYHGQSSQSWAGRRRNDIFWQLLLIEFYVYGIASLPYFLMNRYMGKIIRANVLLSLHHCPTPPIFTLTGNV